MSNTLQGKLIDKELEVSTNKEKKKSLYDSLEGVKAEYDSMHPKATMPDTLGLTPIEYITQSDEEMKNIAEDSVALQKEKDVATATAKAEGKIAKEELKSQEMRDEIQDDIAKIREEGEDKKQASVNKAIKQGIYNSSIPTSVANDIDRETIAEEQGKVETLKSKQASIDAQIETYRDELSTALEEYRLKYAKEVQAKIANLQSQLKANNEKIVKYNNDIKEKEANYQKKRAEFIANQEKEQEELSAYEEKNGYSGDKADNYEKRYQLAKEYYDTMDPSEALADLESDDVLKSYLGLNYKKLKYYLLMKK